MGTDPDDLLLPTPDIRVSEEDLAEIRRLYHEAFARFGTMALWSTRELENPSPAEALTITQALRVHAGMVGRRLAERIEGLCRAAD